MSTTCEPVELSGNNNNNVVNNNNNNKPGEGDTVEAGSRPATLPRSDGGGNAVIQHHQSSSKTANNGGSNGLPNSLSSSPVTIPKRGQVSSSSKLSQLLSLPMALTMGKYCAASGPPDDDDKLEDQPGYCEEPVSPVAGECESFKAGTPPEVSDSISSYLRWAQNLHFLLNDKKGVDLFIRFLKQENCDTSPLFFWFACEGLMKHAEPDNVPQLIKLIYRKFIRGGSSSALSHTGYFPIALQESTRKEISDKMTSGSKRVPDRHIFYAAQQEVEQRIAKSTYPNFLKSDVYLQYVQKMQSGGGGGGGGVCGLGDMSPRCGNGGDCSTTSASGCCSLPSSRSSSSGGRPDVGNYLPTVMEDYELHVSSATPGKLTLTSSNLAVTQMSRVSFTSGRRPESNAGVYLRPNAGTKAVNPYHITYATIIPGSAQDSEIQSLSSDAHTDETVSLPDNTLDSSAVMVKRKVLKEQNRTMIQDAMKNKEPYICPFIPRTQRELPETNKLHANPAVFASILIAKLEDLKRKLEADEKISESFRKLDFHDDVKCNVMPSKAEMQRQYGYSDGNISGFPPPITMLNAALQKHPISATDEDDDQMILDAHVSRVWNDSAHQTPSRSPKRHSPPLEKRRVSAPPSVPFPYAGKIAYLNAQSTHHHRHRKDRDVVSLMSNDSGAFTDFVSESLGSATSIGNVAAVNSSGAGVGHHKYYHHHPTKSKIGSADCLDSQRSSGMLGESGGVTCQTAESSSSSSSQQKRYNRDLGKRGNSKRFFMDSSSSGIDSGVSVVNEPNQPMPSICNSREKVVSWVLENEKYSDSLPSDSEKGSSTHHKKSSYSSLSAISPGPNRQGRGKKPNMYNASRSESLERSGHMPRPCPPQQFTRDPSMPPPPACRVYPVPDTTMQLEEARRRLEDDTKSKLAKSKSGSSSKDRGMMYLDLARGSRPSSSKTTPLSSIPFDTSEETSTTNPRKSNKKPSVSVPATTPSGSVDCGEYTIVGYQFSDENVPYRTRLAGKNILLKHFKSLVTKKGNFRYFFKCASDEFGTDIVFEEVSDENEAVPLWEGKIFAKLESID